MAPKDRQQGNGDDVPLPPLWLYALMFLVALALIRAVVGDGAGPAIETVSYSELKARISDGVIAEVEIDGTQITATPRLGDLPGGQETRLRANAPEIGDPALLPLLDQKNVTIWNTAPRETSGLMWFLPWLLILGVYFLMMRRMGGIPGAGGDILGSKVWRVSGERPDVTFADVAGQDEAKREVAELVDFLREPERFARLGARAPSGVLLMGPPGTGKTLLARALAGEAGVPFFSTSGSAFIELYVGVGASRVRRMFEAARKAAPAIVFIDELDSIGRVRGTGLGGGHDEREQTLNQILAELDGFTGREAVVVLAATNRPDVLDPALLRPGRFDRHVTLSLPDRAARRAILEVHAKKVRMGADVALDEIAAGTPGFSGADLRNLINEAAIAAAREGAREVSRSHLDQARDRVMMGTVRTLAMRPEERHRIAVHESGHAAAAFYLPDADPLLKVTIIPRGRSLGGTHLLPEEERHTLPENYLRAQLAIMLAGRAAEQVFLGSVSSGAEDDIRRATAMARAMVARWGMGKDIGPVDLSQSEEHPFLGREIAQPRTFADRTAARVDEAVAALIAEAGGRARKALEENREAVARLVARLEQEEVLERAQIEACLKPGPGRTLGVIEGRRD
ncbi:ATP-dependent zinc metalloprotease FtsH [Limibaculum sp. FT325]|uniref:ATP-dependent zinc metalloprotease FtsH n=1 Tax=Thermohalobaculum sediminis TaxID=2939436 RepID=UPI0020BF0F90|nr:ATP-dependent zinc metalloprotease FtsH [Limibaculum sediminis]MCL5779054.1 ATP-dependent zinc metalloprotease FtsH [Limibaculum sediminis]